jgi:hypothetical protein
MRTGCPEGREGGGGAYGTWEDVLGLEDGAYKMDEARTG